MDRKSGVAQARQRLSVTLTAYVRSRMFISRVWWILEARLRLRQFIWVQVQMIEVEEVEHSKVGRILESGERH